MMFDPISYRAIQVALGDAMSEARGDQLYNAALEMYSQGKAKGAFPISQEVAVALRDSERLVGPPIITEHMDRACDPRRMLTAMFELICRWVFAGCHLTPGGQQSEGDPLAGQPESAAASEGSDG